MSEHTDDDGRANALEAFANLGRNDPPGQAMIPAQAISLGGDRIIGAQKLAIYRDPAKVLQRLSALGAAAGEGWYYSFPVKNRKKGTTTNVEGLTIKGANDVAREYGNCRVDVRVHDLGDSWLFYAEFTDVETGYQLTRPFLQRKNASQMGDDDARRLEIAFSIGTSKAIRNVTVNALQTYADYAFECAKEALVAKVRSDLPRWRERIATRVAEHLDIRRVERVVGRVAAEWLAPDVARVYAMMKAIAEGMASLDETFPPIEESVDGETGEVTEALAEFAQAEAEKPTEPEEAKTEESAQADPAQAKAKGGRKAKSGEDTPATSAEPAQDEAATASEGDFE